MGCEYEEKLEGYVQYYRIEATDEPSQCKYYFEVAISADEEGKEPQTTWALPRDKMMHLLDTVRPTNSRYAVSYSNTHQGIIATLKDALHNRNKVQLEGTFLGSDIANHNPPSAIPDFVPRDDRVEAPDLGGVDSPTIVDSQGIGSKTYKGPNYELMQVTIFRK